MNLDLALMGIESEEILRSPQQTEDRLDVFFENSDYGLPPEAADDFTMQLPMGKVAKVSRARMKSCKTDAELRQLDREIYASCGLDPARYGI